MTLVTPNKMAVSIFDILNRKSYGLVSNGDKYYYRNYGRVLKNGKGLSLFEAAYSCFQPDYQSLFKVEP